MTGLYDPDENLSPQISDAIARYHAAWQAMAQSTVRRVDYDPEQGSPARLLIGMKAAMVEHSALADLLLRLGLITKSQYYTTLASWMEAENERLDKWFAERFPGREP